MIGRRWSPGLILLVGCSIETSAARAADTPAPPVARSLVVSGQGYFPVALRLADGRIAVVLRGGAPHVGIQGRLDIGFSGDEGQTWTRPAVVTHSPVDDRNPAFGQAKDGTLVVAFFRTARYDAQGRYNERLTDKPVNTWVTRSADGGKSWSQAAEIDAADIGWGSPYGKMLTLPANSIGRGTSSWRATRPAPTRGIPAACRSQTAGSSRCTMPSAAGSIPSGTCIAGR
jgi:hypothetical protein